jgi:predicted SAM-dependent methyltransferase
VTPTRLHIGGQVRADGWTVVDVQPGAVVDIVASCVDLGVIADASVSEVYASHVLEHLGFREVPRALSEWHRVLEPGGRVSISVPDLAKLGPTLAHPRLENHVRDWIIAVIYGGQTDDHDFHKIGFTFETLGRYLQQAGFAKIMRVAEFDLFEDSSRLRLGPTLISLNMMARKPELA